MSHYSSRTTLAAVIFDVDGTLADTERDGHRPAFNAAFREAGLSWDWDVALYGELLAITGGKERIRHYMEKYCPAELNRSGLDDWIAGLHKAKTRHFVALLERGEIPLRTGVARLLQELRAANIKIAIATTTTPENVTALLKSTLGEDSPGWFEVIGAGDIVPAKKPAPDIYLWVLEQLGLTAPQCIALEDSENGLKSALVAGLATVITVSDYTRLHDFTGAAAVLSDLGEPGQPFSVLAGNTHGHGWVDPQMLVAWKHLLLVN